MSSRLGGSYRIAVGKSGRPVVVEVKRRRDVCTELKRKKSRRVRVVRRGAKCAS